MFCLNEYIKFRYGKVPAVAIRGRRWCSRRLFVEDSTSWFPSATGSPTTWLFSSGEREFLQSPVQDRVAATGLPHLQQQDALITVVAPSRTLDWQTSLASTFRQIRRCISFRSMQLLRFEGRLRFEPALNNQRRRIRLAADFEIDRWTADSLRDVVRVDGGRDELALERRVGSRPMDLSVAFLGTGGAVPVGAAQYRERARRARRRTAAVRLRGGDAAADAALARPRPGRRDLLHPLPRRSLPRPARPAQNVRPDRARSSR